MRREIRVRNGAFVLLAFAVGTLGCIIDGGSTGGQGGSATSGWHGTGAGGGITGVGGRAGAGGTTGGAGAGGTTGGAGAGGTTGGAGAAGGSSGAGIGGGQGGAGATGGAAGAGGGSSGGGAGAGGGTAGGGGGQVDAGTKAGHDAGALVCPICGKGTTCAFLIAGGCSAVGTCVKIPVTGVCNAVTDTTACGCDGRNLTWQDGCFAVVPDGYAPAPIAHLGFCP